MVSVVMPARNAEATLNQSIRSILDQTYPNLELVLVDHDSTDGTLDVMNRWARSENRISIHRCSGTFIEACNLAWIRSEGDLVARMDSDDFAHAAKIEKQVRFLANHPELSGCATRVRILKRSAQGDGIPPDRGYADYEKWINSVNSPVEIARQRFVDSPLPNPTVMLRREILESFAGFRDLSWAEDYDLWLRMLHDGHRIGKVEETLLDWFDGESRVTRTSERYSLDSFQRAKAHFLSRLDLVRAMGVVISGAGPTGKKMARLFGDEGIRVHALFEVNPKQIGGMAQGHPVLPVGEIPGWENRAVMISAVGQPGARERIRNLLAPTAFVEGENFFCVA